MYLGVDVGGTKTLVAALDDHGVILKQARVPTPKKYTDFLKEIEKALASFKHQDFKAGGMGVPATAFNRHRGIGIRFGNLPWRDVPLQSDMEKLARCPV